MLDAYRVKICCDRDREASLRTSLRAHQRDSVANLLHLTASESVKEEIYEVSVK